MADGQIYNTRDPAIDQDKIVLGEYPGATASNRFSCRNNIPAASGQVYIGGDEVTDSFTVLLSPTPLTITYNNATDGSGTNGALVLLFEYIDENILAQTAIHVLGGTGSDTTSFSALGLNGITVIASGASDINNNDISVAAVSDGSVQGFIKAGDSISAFSAIHVPINATLVAKYILYTAVKSAGGPAAAVDFQIDTYNRALQTRYKRGSISIGTNLLGVYQQADPGFAPLPGGSVITLLASTTSDFVNVTAGFTSVIYENP